jgi:hypothetical protein
LLVSLSGSFQTSPSFFLNWQNGVNYNLATQTPQYRIQSLQGFAEPADHFAQYQNSGNPD